MDDLEKGVLSAHTAWHTDSTFVNRKKCPFLRQVPAQARQVNSLLVASPELSARNLCHLQTM